MYRGQGATPRGCDISAPLLSAVLSTGGQGVRLPPCPSSGCGWTDGHPTITGGPYTYLPLFWMLCSTLIKRNRAVQGRGAALGAVERSGWLGSRSSLSSDGEDKLVIDVEEE